MRRFITLFAILALGLLVACGGGDDDSSDSDASPGAGDSGTTAASPAPEVTATTGSGGGSVPDGSKDDFCTPDNIDAVFDGFEFTSDLTGLRDQFSAMDGVLDGWADNAPSEIRDDVEVLADGVHGLIELFEEYDYDFIAIGTGATSDPRFLALESDAFQAATNRLSEYCGYDVDPPLPPNPELSGLPGAPGGTPDGALPEDFPAALIPPDSEVDFAGLIGPGIGAQFSSTGTFDEIVAFYTAALGGATVADAESTIWSIMESGSLTTVTVTGTDGNVDIGIALVTP